MSRRLYLVLLIAILIGVQPVFAQDANKPTVDLEEVSDQELTEALDSASGIELINKNDLTQEQQDQLEESNAIAEENPADEQEPAEEPALAKETPADADTQQDSEPSEPVLAEEETSADAEPALAEETSEDTEQEEVASDISNNKYFLESQRLAKLADEAYNYGDYDSSSVFAEDSIRNAKLSDEYVARRLKGEKDEDIIAALDAAQENPPLPATYTVRTWGSVKDCFWNIAGRPWVYGNPYQWRKLYEANKSKLPEPNNPNLIEPGIVLDIPSLKGEERQGSWDADKTYEPIK